MLRTGLRIERWGSGFTLIEVMVAAAIFSLGLAGLSLMLMLAVHGTAEARNRTTAVAQAASLAELILLNPAAVGHYMAPAPATTDCIGDVPCSGAEWATGNFARWQYDLQQNLTHAEGLVCRDATPHDGTPDAPACDGAGQPVVKVFWREPGLADALSGGPQRVALPVVE